MCRLKSAPEGEGHFTTTLTPKKGKKRIKIRRGKGKYWFTKKFRGGERNKRSAGKGNQAKMCRSMRGRVVKRFWGKKKNKKVEGGGEEKRFNYREVPSYSKY